MVRYALATLFNQGSSGDQPAFNERLFTVQMQKEELSSASVLWFYRRVFMRVSAMICAKCQCKRQTWKEENCMHDFEGLNCFIEYYHTV
jgi:hypothetical protein